MGVNTWYAFGSAINENVIVGLANAMLARGLVAAGYRYLWLDAGWWQGLRSPNGAIAISPSQWPHGLSWLTTYLHHRGMRAGIYTDAGINGCDGPHQGSFGHLQQDIDTFAAWGFDAVKVDFCGANRMGLRPRAAAERVAAAIAADEPRRPMLFNFCDGAVPNHYFLGLPTYDTSAYATHVYAPGLANSWRTGPDIGVPGLVTFAGMLNNLDWDALWPYDAGPGHWNDPDYIVPDEGMTPAQAQTQFSMWAILAAPMMLSEDVRVMPQRTLAMVTNREALAISHDRLAVQGWLLWRRGPAELWVRPLAGGARAIALLNRGNRPVWIRAVPGALGLPVAPRYAVRDVWRTRTFLVPGVRTRRIPVPVPPGSRGGKRRHDGPRPTITVTLPAPAIQRLVPAGSTDLLRVSAA
jgi:alpha-galactosidase